MGISWEARALCLPVVMSGGVDLWFPPEPGDPDYTELPGGGEIIARYNKGRKICHVCPVRRECLKFAVDNKIQYGMWGGKSPGQRGMGRKKKQPKRAA